ncbi:MAG: NAD(+)/NADH kinase [Bifidobacteriaceae bacterium]|jgi:diacylglycerol kinase family enzyme|nr:NAD(+)/NADH kinase [Bifidobacteriaceae bacterium]
MPIIDLLIAIFIVFGIIIILLIISAIIYFLRKSYIERVKVQLLQRRIPSQKNRRLKYAFIINPSKKKANSTVEYIKQFFIIHKFPQPQFYYTEKDFPGGKQAQLAIDNKADVIVAVGGDGTARAVAQIVSQNDRCFGLIPIGTANIFARNLDLEPTKLYKCLLTVIAGHSKMYDIGFVKVQNTQNYTWSGDSKQAFLAVAGLGFDAAMIATTSEKLKRRIGWLAYFTGSLKQMRNPRITAKVDILDTDKITHNIYDIQIRSLLFGNVSKIPGLTLIPPARPNDGKLDFVALDTKANILGWGQLFNNIVMQSMGLEKRNTLKISNINHRQGLSAKVKTNRPVYLQLDGDIMGQISQLQIGLKPSALTVLVPNT